MSLTAPKSASATATSSAVAINSDFSCMFGVTIAVDSGQADGVEIIGKDDSTGLTCEEGKSVFIPCQNLNEVLVKRQGGSDITYTYYAR